MRIIFLIMIGFSLINADFTKSNGMVTDSKTGLIWQDEYSDNNNTIKSSSWQDAIDYCEALTLGGNNDWRLPNIKELLSIVDYSKSNPSINAVFQNTSIALSPGYWSSTTLNYPSGTSWCIDWRSGRIMQCGKEQAYDILPFSRCVRTGQ